MDLAFSLEQIGAASGVIGAVVVGFKKAGLITFGKSPKCSTARGQCKDHAEQSAAIHSLKVDAERRGEKLDDVSEKLSRVAEGVARIEGHLQAKNGFHT